MLSKEMEAIIAAARPQGWVMEPEAKRLFGLAGLTGPRHGWARSLKEALAMAEEIGYPLVAKVVSPAVVHKSDSHGVEVGIRDAAKLSQVYERFSRVGDFAGVLVEEMVAGLELIVGAKHDPQFGPVVLLGMGGTGVEIYGDTAIRMAPVTPADVEQMIGELAARRLFDGYRGGKPVNRAALAAMLVRFSELAMALAPELDSIDLNPVFCNEQQCLVADARIMLAGGAV